MVSAVSLSFGRWTELYLLILDLLSYFSVVSCLFFFILLTLVQSNLLLFFLGLPSVLSHWQYNKLCRIVDLKNTECPSLWKQTMCDLFWAQLSLSLFILVGNICLKFFCVFSIDQIPAYLTLMNQSNENQASLLSKNIFIINTIYIMSNRGTKLFQMCEPSYLRITAYFYYIYTCFCAFCSRIPQVEASQPGVHQQHTPSGKVTSCTIHIFS